MTEPVLAKQDRDKDRYYELFGKPLYSVSGFDKNLARKGLEIWTARKIAVGMAKYPELLASVQSVVHDLDGCESNEERKPFNRVVDAAWREAKEKDNRPAARGTAVHKASELYDMGIPMERIVSEEWEMSHDSTRKFDDEELAYLDQYIKAVKDFGLESVLIEQTVYHQTAGGGIGYAGSFDRIYRCPARFDGCVVGDVKTGTSTQAAVARQLAGYANAEGIITPDGELLPMPEDLRKDLGLVIHVGKDFAEVVPVAIERAWQAFQSTVNLFDYLKFHEPFVLGEAWDVRDEFGEVAS